MTAATCEGIKAAINTTDGFKKFGNLMCCSESLCNKPDPVLDPSAHILDQTNGGGLNLPGTNQTSAAGVLAVPHMLGSWFAMLLAAAMGGVLFMG